MLRTALLALVTIVALSFIVARYMMAVRHSEVVYRYTEQVELQAHVFQPPRLKSAKGAVLFFHGGGWWVGSRRHFVPFARKLARNGYVSVTIDYRVHGKHGTSIEDALADARSALRWVATNEDTWGIQRKGISLGGGSAGGHLAACLATACDQEDEAADIRSLLLMNPVLDLTTASESTGFSGGELDLINALSEARRLALSPLYFLQNAKAGILIAFGEEDPLYTSYARRLESLEAEILVYPGLGHGFFNDRSLRNEITAAMLRTLDRAHAPEAPDQP